MYWDNILGGFILVVYLTPNLQELYLRVIIPTSSRWSGRYLYKEIMVTMRQGLLLEVVPNFQIHLNMLSIALFPAHV